jgi:hypothetical protein
MRGWRLVVWVWRDGSTNPDIWLWQEAWMSVAMVLGRQTQDERKKHEADGLLLFRRKDENLAAYRLWRVTVRLHSGRRFTCSDRYFRRIFSS